MTIARVLEEFMDFPQFLRHKLPVDVVFQKLKSIEIRIERDRENRRKVQNFHFFIFFGTFSSILKKSQCYHVFQICDFHGFWGPDDGNLEKSMTGFHF